MDTLKSLLSNYLIKFYIISQFVSRVLIVIYAIFYKQIELNEISTILFFGIFNDIIFLTFLYPILSIFSSISTNLQYRVHLFFYFIIIFIFCTNILGELIFWDEYGTKYNFIAVDYLIYTREIVGTLKESLPVSLLISLLSLISLAITYYSRNFIKHSKPLLSPIGFVLSLSILMIASQYYTPCKFSNNRFANDISKNGPYEFFRAFTQNSLDYELFYPLIPSNEAIERVRELVKEKNQNFIDTNSITRNIKAPAAHKRYNVVFIVVESLSANFLQYFGNNDGITPNLDRIIKSSILFDNMYATGTRTVRGLEAITLSIPPTPGSSIIRRPHNDNLFNIGTVFKKYGYDTRFIFGGYSYFDNLHKFFSTNNFEIIDRSDLSSSEVSFSNIWGVADEDILMKSLEYSNKSFSSTKPFFHLILTTSNHRPYTFPENRIDLKSGSGRNAAVKYTDYAIGKFLENASTQPWFKDTIFIITADHCASSAGRQDLPISKYHIPLIIYAPHILKPQISQKLVSQIDIAPTILGMLNFSYESKFFGKDMLNSQVDRAFISTYQLLGYYKGNDKLAVLEPKKEISGTITPLAKEAISFYQSAYLFYKTGTLKQK